MAVDDSKTLAGVVRKCYLNQSTSDYFEKIEFVCLIEDNDDSKIFDDKCSKYDGRVGKMEKGSLLLSYEKEVREYPKTTSEYEIKELIKKENNPFEIDLAMGK